MLQKNNFMTFGVFPVFLDQGLWDFAAGEFDETLALKVSKHSSDNFPVGTKMISNRLMSDFQLVCSFDRGLF